VLAMRINANTASDHSITRVRRAYAQEKKRELQLEQELTKPAVKPACTTIPSYDDLRSQSQSKDDTTAQAYTTRLENKLQSISHP